VNRAGIGYDVHAFADGRPLWLGCVHFEDAGRGLAGHSDADVVAHAICDALLGAAGLGDIGDHFPDTDAKWKDAAGATLLSEVAAKVRSDGFEIENIDCVVMSDAVRLGERKKQMEDAMAQALDLNPDRINVKATTFEGHGAVGRGEVIACEAIATLSG